MKFLKINRGSITIEASLVFIIFILGYFIINSIVLSLITESITRKALYETGIDISNLMQILDRAGINDKISTNTVKSDDYKNIIINEIKTNSSEKISTNIVNNLIDLLKTDISSRTQKFIYLKMIKELFVKKLENLSPKQNFENLGVIGGKMGFNFNELKLLESGNEININLVYGFKLDRFGFITKKNKISQNFLVEAWINNKKSNNFDSIWNETNFERGRYFANKTRNETRYPIAPGQGFDYYESNTNTLVQVISLNIFNKTYSEKKEEIYEVRDDFIKKIKIYYKEVEKNWDKIDGNLAGMDMKELKINNPKIKLEIILPEESLEKTNLKSYMNEISSIGNISFLYIEKALNE